MSIKECVAMILAGGRGELIGTSARHYQKPTVHFGRKYRIIDFTLSNCEHSKIGNIGIISQYFSDDLHAYIDYRNDYQRENGGIYMLPPRKNDLYNGNADAVYKNIDFIEQFKPEHVLILFGDHIYKMDYSELIAYHKCTNADVTMASTKVTSSDASGYGIINADMFGRVFDFEEKPRYPKTSLALMGVYIFKWETLKNYLLSDNVNSQSYHDLGKDILPFMLHTGRRIYTYVFNEYWRYIETVESLLDLQEEELNYPFSFNFFEYERETLNMYIAKHISK